jgi:hypothetical protein
MKTKTLFRHLASAALLTISIANRAQASVIIDISQVGDNVVATGSGTINTAGLTLLSTAGAATAGSMYPSFGNVTLGPAGTEPGNDLYSGSSGPANFGSGGNSVATSGTGDIVFAENGIVGVPQDYTSGSALSGNDTWDSTTISGLGLTPGTYTYTWGSGGNADSLTVNIQSPAPEPGTVCLLSFGVLGLVLNRMHTRKRTLNT